MNFHDLSVIQKEQVYNVFTPNGVWIAQIYMGNDNQYLLDAKVMDYICRALARRWNVGKK